MNDPLPRADQDSGTTYNKVKCKSPESLNIFNTWIKPEVEEVPIGMEINGYLPAE